MSSFSRNRCLSESGCNDSQKERCSRIQNARSRFVELEHSCCVHRSGSELVLSSGFERSVVRSNYGT